MVSSIEKLSLRIEARQEKANKTDAPQTGPRVSVVIPALNEADNLPHVLPRIPRSVHEVLLVDGHSTDGTVEKAIELWPDIRIIRQKGKGKGNALRCGFEAATGDIIVMLDADGSTDPSEIPHFVQTLLNGADFAKGSRFLKGGGTADMPFYRKLGNQFFVVLVRALFGGRYSDLCYGYNAFWFYVLPSIHLDSDGFEIETKLNLQVMRSAFRIVEVPSFEEKRIYGTSRLKTIPDGLRVLRTILHEAFEHKKQTFSRKANELHSGRRDDSPFYFYRKALERPEARGSSAFNPAPPPWSNPRGGGPQPPAA